MSVTISGDTGVSAVQSGAVDLTTDVTGVLPNANGGTGLSSAGTSGNALVSNGTTWTSGKQTITSGTAVASTSGTSIDFTGIPSWVKRITVMFNGVSTNGTSAYQVQIGDSGGIENSGYDSVSAQMYPNAAGTLSSTTGFVFFTNSAAIVLSGQIVITNFNLNAWVASGNASNTSTNNLVFTTGGTKTLSATLDRIRITTVNGTNTFDAGSINILYE